MTLEEAPRTLKGALMATGAEQRPLSGGKADMAQRWCHVRL